VKDFRQSLIEKIFSFHLLELLHVKLNELSASRTSYKARNLLSLLTTIISAQRDSSSNFWLSIDLFSRPMTNDPLGRKLEIPGSSPGEGTFTAPSWPNG
jgi:hypothetical protein